MIPTTGPPNGETPHAPREEVTRQLRDSMALLRRLTKRVQSEALLARQSQDRMAFLAGPAERLRFEALLVDLSAAFVNLPADAVDSQIEYALERLVRFLDVDRSSFGELSDDKRGMRVTH